MVRKWLKIFCVSVLVLTLTSCSLREDIRSWIGEKTGTVVEQAKEEAKEEFKKQMNSAIDDVKRNAKDFATDKVEDAKQAVKDLAAEQLNRVREEGQKQLAENLEKAAEAIKPTPKSTPTPAGVFAYLNYTPATLAQAKTTATFLFFFDENSALSRSLDKYFTETLDPVGRNINVLRVNVTKDSSLALQHGSKAPDELIRVDEKGRELGRVQGEAYADATMLKKVEEGIQ